MTLDRFLTTRNNQHPNTKASKMDNPLDMTKKTLERLDAEASKTGHQKEAQHPQKNVSLPSEDEKGEAFPIQAASEVVPEERPKPERRSSVENEMMPPPPSPARRPKSTTPRREFSQPRWGKANEDLNI